MTDSSSDAAGADRSAGARELRAGQAVVAQQLASLQLVSQRLAAGVLSGLHRSVFRGGSAEFAEYKEYAPGDDPRTIDWKTVARADRWFVKRFEETTNRRCWLLLDASASMAFTRGGRASKLDTARLLLAALATLLLRQGDSVACAAVRAGGREGVVPPRSRGSHLEAILEHLVMASPAGTTGLAPALDEVASAIPRRALIVLATDLIDDLDAVGGALRRLGARGHEILVLQVLDADEIAFPFTGTLRFQDPETGQEVTSEAAQVAASYRLELERFLASCQSACAAAGAELVRTTNGEDPGQALLRFLARRRGLVRRMASTG